MSSLSSARTRPDLIGTPSNLTPPPKQQAYSAANSQSDQEDIVDFVKNLSKLRDAL